MSAATARGLLKVVASVRFLGLLHFLADMFTILSSLSKAFQQDTLTVSDVPVLIRGTKKKLTKLRKKVTPNGYLESFAKNYNEDEGSFKSKWVSLKHAT